MQHKRTNPVSVVILALCTVLFSGLTQAHVKWFVPLEGNITSTYMPYGLFDTPVLIWIAVALFFISASIILDSFLPVLAALKNARQEYLMYLLKLCTGLSLVM